MTADLEEFLERYHHSVEAFIKGNPSRQERIWSRRDDVTLANPLGPPARGWAAVSEALGRAVFQLGDGEVLAVDRILRVCERRSRVWPFASRRSSGARTTAGRCCIVTPTR